MKGLVQISYSSWLLKSPNKNL